MVTLCSLRQRRESVKIALFHLICIASLLALTLFVYWPSTKFGVSFDDTLNLKGLASITDSDSALEFVFGGSSGPLGRPLSLATFLPALNSWPSAPEDFIRQNIYVHSLNLILVIWLALRLAPYLPWRVSSPEAFALMAGAWWGTSPLLHSTSAMIIQRMTSLSATFSLIGLLIYLLGRDALPSNARRGFFLMTVGVLLGTFLAVLAKENGALLPGFVLLLERTIAARRPGACLLPHHINVWFLRWQTLFLTLPCAVLICYLIWHLPEYAAGHHAREFTLLERLYTQARILIVYLRLFLLPNRAELGPYHDDFSISHGVMDPSTTLISIATLAVAISLAWRLRSSQFRLVSFALGWFLWGHLFESTVVPLELYFEHRSYLPVLGLSILIPACLYHPDVAVPLRLTFASIVLGSNLFILRESSLLWSEQGVASAVWYEQHPASLRAFQLHLKYLSDHAPPAEYLAAVDSALPPLSLGAEYAILKLATGCGLRDEAFMKDSAEHAAKVIASKRFNMTVPQALDQLVDLVDSESCRGLGTADLERILTAGIQTSAPISDDVRAQFYEIAARVRAKRQDFKGTMGYLQAAFSLRPTLSHGMTMAAMLASVGRFDEANLRLDEVEKLKPTRPFQGARWQAEIDDYRETIKKMVSVPEAS
jgi:hypothetical protein